LGGVDKSPRGFATQTSRGLPAKEPFEIPQQKRRRVFTSWHAFSTNHWLHFGSERSTDDSRITL
jgi:hypothetical protein